MRAVVSRGRIGGLGQLGQTPTLPSRALPKLPELGNACAGRLTNALALGPWFRWCRFLWELFPWRLFPRCPGAAPSAAYYALRAAPSPAPCGRCGAPCAASYDWCAGPDVVPWHQCAGPDALACHRCAGSEAGSEAGLEAGPGADPHLAFEPQHPMLLAPRLAFPCQMRRLFPKFQASFDARSCPLQFFHSCSASLVAQILAGRLIGDGCA